MRRRAIPALALVAMIAATALDSGAGAAQTPRRRPRLRQAGNSPLKVAGSAFKSLERVRVTVTVGELKRVRNVRASRAGRFTATFETSATGPAGATCRAPHGVRRGAARA